MTSKAALIIALFLPLIYGFIFTSDASKKELKYDDGTSEMSGSPWREEVGSEIAVRFTPPSYPFALQSVRFYVTDHREPRTKFAVRIYSTGSDNFPGSRIDNNKIFGRAKSGNEWVEIDVSDQEIIITKGDFFVSMYWLVAPGSAGGSAQFLGCDTSSRIANRTYWKYGQAGSWTLRTDKNMMIRVYYEDNAGSVE